MAYCGSDGQGGGPTEFGHIVGCILFWFLLCVAAPFVAIVMFGGHVSIFPAVFAIAVPVVLAIFIRVKGWADW